MKILAKNKKREVSQAPKSLASYVRQIEKRGYLVQSTQAAAPNSKVKLRVKASLKTKANTQNEATANLVKKQNELILKIALFGLDCWLRRRNNPFY